MPAARSARALITALDVPVDAVRTVRVGLLRDRAGPPRDLVIADGDGTGRGWRESSNSVCLPADVTLRLASALLRLPAIVVDPADCPHALPDLRPAGRRAHTAGPDPVDVVRCTRCGQTLPLGPLTGGPLSPDMTRTMGG